MMDIDRKLRVDKVLRAMLAMQRRAWEQGVAAQSYFLLMEAAYQDFIV